MSLSGPAFGQGLILNEDGIDLVPQKESSEGSKNVDEKIDNTYAVSLREHCPSPQDQGQDANCVGWSVGYAAQTIRKAYLEKITDKRAIDSMAFSPYFIYNNIKLKDCEMGAEIPEALQFLIRTGNVLFTHFEEGKSDCYATPKNGQYEEAMKNRISNFQKLFTPDDSKQKKIREVKEALINGFPVVIAMNITESFTKLSFGDAVWYSEGGSQIPQGGHALVVIGFDELSNSFEVMNSWGDRWADGGFVHIRYEDFDKYVKYGFCFADKLDKQFSMMINFKRNIMISNEGKASFEKELFRWNENKYSLVSSKYHPNTNYVIDIYHSDSDYKLYCFNASGQGTYNELFRIDGSENQLITNIKSFGFTLPPLKFTDPESERFVFIICKNILSQERINEISFCSSDEQINTLFADEINKTDRIISYSRVAITGSIENNTMIIPIEFGVK